MSEILKIINYYGVNAQQRQFAEEVFELQEAITKRETHWNYDTEIQDIKPLIKKQYEYGANA